MFRKSQGHSSGARLLVSLVFVLFAAACSGPQTPDPKEIARLAAQAVKATLTAQPTPPMPPTATSLPTTTHPPTTTPTPVPTATSTASATPTSPSPATVAAPTFTPQPATNVAIGKPSSADSWQVGNLAVKGNDGDAKTRWGAADSRANHWWVVDLGSLHDLIGSEVTWELDRKAYKYKVEASSDQTDWIVVADQTQNTRATQVQRDSFTARGRYVRVTVTSLEPGAWASFYEFSVFGSPAPTPTPTSTPTPTLTPTATSTPMPATATAAAQATATAHADAIAANATALAQEAIATVAAATAAVQAAHAAATVHAAAVKAFATAAVQDAKATATAYACLNAAYGADVTVPDGTRFDANANFVKTWRVKNTGKCDWNEGVVIAFESGDRLDAPLTAPVGALPVGQQVDVSVSMRAPNQAGKYTGVWRMQDTAGRFFGEPLTVNVISAGIAPIPAPTLPPTATPALTFTPVPSSSQWSCTEFDAPFRVVWIKSEADVYRGVDQPVPSDVKGHITGGAGGVEASCSRPGYPTFYRLRGVGWWGWVKASDTQ